jgi:uncharacterized membrane protein
MVFSRFMPFLLAILAVFVALLSRIWLDWGFAILLAANAFFLTYLTLTLAKISKLTKDYLKHHAAASDAPVLFIFAVTLAAVVTSVVSLFIVINVKDSPGAMRMALALSAVPLGWLTIHLMAAIHYAHLFWQPAQGQGVPRRGMEFPGTTEPEGWDFVYFAYVIGMAAQTSDVAISERHIRSFVLMHSVVAFFFNTVLVAATVNFAVSL